MGGGTSPGATRENGRARTAQHQQPKGSKSDGADNKETAMDKQPERDGTELIDAILKEIGERMGRGDGRLVDALRSPYNPIPQPEPEGRRDRINTAMALLIGGVFGAAFVWLVLR